MENNMVVSWENALNSLTDLSDKDLYGLCKVCGNNAREWLRKFAVLLIEVSRRGLHRRRGYSSVYEFAAKMVGMNRDTVDRILRLDQILLNKPVLRSLIGEVGWSKIYVVACLATPETDAFWADKVKLLPKGALEVYVRDLKNEEKRKIENNSGAIVSEIGNVCGDNTCGDNVCEVKVVEERNLVTNSLVGLPLQSSIWAEMSGFVDLGPGAGIFPDSLDETWQMFSFKLSDSTLFKFRVWKQKIEKEKRQTLTFNEVLEEIFERLGEV